MVDGATLDNLKKIMVDAMLYGGLIQEIMTSKLITSGVDRVGVF
jgi:hypothetical protein